MVRPHTAAHGHQGAIGITEGIVQQQCRARQSDGKQKGRDTKYNFFHKNSETDRTTCPTRLFKPIIACRPKL
jgi:hypothetical protein